MEIDFFASGFYGICSSIKINLNGSTAGQNLNSNTFLNNLNLNLHQPIENMRHNSIKGTFLSELVPGNNKIKVT